MLRTFIVGVVDVEVVCVIARRHVARLISQCAYELAVFRLLK
jgi:hypothetical protein